MAKDGLSECIIDISEVHHGKKRRNKHLIGAKIATVKGYIQNVAIAGVTDDFASLTQWSETDNAQTLLGAINILNYKLINSVLD